MPQPFSTINRRISLLLGMFILTSPASGAGPLLKQPAQLPPNVDFVRSFDLEGYAERTNQNGFGAQSGRFRFRFRDPEINAFVGMVAGFHHFNEDLRIGDPEKQKLDTSGLLANWGGVFGVVRGRHLWELDLMGSNLSTRLGGAIAVVGEHTLSDQWAFYHRTELNIYRTDVILDADQGLYWMWKPSVGLSLGYRWFTSLHMDRSGPHIGLRLYFESPKIPFIFPSLG